MENNKINILHVVLGLKTGGLEKVVIELTRFYSDRFISHIVCLESNGDLGDRCKNVKIYELKSKGFSIRTVIRLALLAKKINAKIIHTHNPSPHIHGALAGLIVGIPVIHTKHGRNHPDKAKNVFLNRFASFFTKVIAAVSTDVANVSINIEKVPCEKVVTVVNGINLSEFKKREIESTPNSIPQVAIVARLSPEKDHMTLLQACSEIKSRGIPFKLKVIGDGVLRKELELATERLSLSNEILFLGLQYDIPLQLQAVDVFVLSSLKEGMSLTLLEAMASSVPIVATNVGGNPEVVADGVTGFIVPPKDSVAMANKIIELLSGLELRTKMGNAGRKRVEELFDFTKTVAEYERIYDENLSEREN